MFFECYNFYTYFLKLVLYINVYNIFVYLYTNFYEIFLNLVSISYEKSNKKDVVVYDPKILSNI